MQRDLLAGTTLWGVPMMTEGLGLFVNEDLFAAAGVSVPKTYVDLLDIVPQLTVRNEDELVTSAIALGATNNVEHFSDILALMIMQNGGKLTNPVGQEAEEALVFFLKFSNSSDPMYTWNGLQDNSVSAFANKKVAMMIAPSWRAFDVRQINPNLRFHIEPVPQLSEAPVTWASYWAEGISSQSKHKEQAFEFLSYLTSEENTMLLYAEAAKARLFGPPYARKELGSQLLNDPFAGAFIEQAPYARSFPLASNTYDNGLNDEMIQYMENAVNAVAAGSSPAEALTTMSQGFQQVLSKNGLATNQQSQ
jgi:ABC-type glycerol-3-phosphate transport system substrate-binding protein